MRIRIVDPLAKIAYVMGAAAVGLTLGAGVSVAAGASSGMLLGAIVLVVAIGLAARTFRAPGEPVRPPRLWWQLTAAPTAGWVMCALLVLAAAANLVPPGAGGAAPAALQIALAAAYAHSSLRLTRRARPRRRGASPG